jgi:hypothetical protein
MDYRLKFSIVVVGMANQEEAERHGLMIEDRVKGLMAPGDLVEFEGVEALKWHVEKEDIDGP